LFYAANTLLVCVWFDSFFSIKIIAKYLVESVDGFYLGIGAYLAGWA